MYTTTKNDDRRAKGGRYEQDNLAGAIQGAVLEQDDHERKHCDQGGEWQQSQAE